MQRRSMWSSVAVVAAAVMGSVVVPAPARAQGQPQAVWLNMQDFPGEVQAQAAWVRPKAYRAVRTNLPTLRQTFAGILREPAPLPEGLEAAPPMPVPPTIIQLPDPNGGFQAFRVYESSVMAPELEALFPEIKTYVGQGLDDPAATLRMDVTPLGFHAQVLSPQGSWYIDPFSRGNTDDYAVFYKRDLAQPHAFVCEVVAPEVNAFLHDPIDQEGFLASGPTLRRYDTAVAATAEYTAFFGGTVALGQAAIVTAMNRVTGVYEVELGIRMTLVANNNLLVYTNSATDPYTNGNGSTMLGQNQTNIDAVIGTANYDIGHVFSTGGGGVAGLGVVCTAGNKARGVTGGPSPTGDAFWIDFVAHEMGHQFGGNHSFNGTNGNCAGGNRNAGTAYEIGSGSTIQAYAGICGADDLQPNSDAYFSFISIQEINAYTQSGGGSGCSTNTATGNQAPTVNAGAAFTIPKGTPFMLTATGSDPDGDAITYCWEERDLGVAQALSAADNGTSPLIRSRNPSTSPTRVVPRLSTVVAGTVDNQEKIPAVARAAFNWRVTARDNRANGGGVAHADVTHVVNGVAGPFTVSSQNSATTWNVGQVQAVTWNVAGTTANGVNTANVAILLSTDGGVTFPITLAASVPNNGSANVTVPNNQTTTGRIMVRAVGNIFFDVNNGVLTIGPPITGVVLSGTGSNTATDPFGTGNNNGNTRIDSGENSIQVSVGVQNGGTIAATGVTATLSSLTGTATIASGVSTYPNLSAGGGTGLNNTPFVVSVSPAHVCGNPINLRLDITSNEGTGVYNFSFPTGQPGGTGSPVTFSYTTPAVFIPDNAPAGAIANLAVSGLTGTIADVNFRFDGTSCNTTPASTTVGLDHTWVGDLVITLQSPTGTIISLANRPGGATNSGVNFCTTTFDDAGGAGSIQSITSAGAPYSNSYTPNAPLSGFNGQNPNGTWQLKVVDAAGLDTGNIRRFSVIVTTQNPPVCDPPAAGVVCPAITGHPGAAALCAGGNANFFVSASGTAPLTYQWRRNTVPLVDGGGISGATTDALAVANVGPANAGTYDCVVTNACGSATSNGAALTVNTPPSINSGPDALTLCAGTNALFTVGASGSGVLTYQWRKDGAPILAATQPSYMIVGVAAASAGTYDCVVSNACGSTTSGGALLTVNAPPTFSMHPASISACQGAEVMISISASGAGPITYQWRRNGSDIFGATDATYTIASLSAGDAGTYDCVATNACGSTPSNGGALDVGASVAITLQPTGQAGPAGSTVVFTVEATGEGPLVYQWRKDGLDLAGENGATLTLSDVDETDVAVYDCVVTGACGEAAVSDPASFTLVSCYTDYNQDGFENPDDIGDYITDYYTPGGIPGPGGYAVPCPFEAPPFDAGWKVDFDQNCQINPDDLGDYITAYYTLPEFGGC
ncbi:MAG: immunoglobulin domain-containing protein [Phycisphaerales bacterium]